MLDETSEITPEQLETLTAALKNGKHNFFMTGQEWYERFERELHSTDIGFVSKEYNDGYADAKIEALEAAKRAAGIEGGTK